MSGHALLIFLNLQSTRLAIYDCVDSCGAIECFTSDPAIDFSIALGIKNSLKVNREITLSFSNALRGKSFLESLSIRFVHSLYRALLDGIYFHIRAKPGAGI